MPQLSSISPCSGNTRRWLERGHPWAAECTMKVLAHSLLVRTFRAMVAVLLSMTVTQLTIASQDEGLRKHDREVVLPSIAGEVNELVDRVEIQFLEPLTKRAIRVCFHEEYWGRVTNLPRPAQPGESTFEVADLRELGRTRCVFERRIHCIK